MFAVVKVDGIGKKYTKLSKNCHRVREKIINNLKDCKKYVKYYRSESKTFFRRHIKPNHNKNKLIYIHICTVREIEIVDLIYSVRSPEVILSCF